MSSGCLNNSQLDIEARDGSDADFKVISDSPALKVAEFQLIYFFNFNSRHLLKEHIFHFLCRSIINTVLHLRS